MGVTATRPSRATDRNSSGCMGVAALGSGRTANCVTPDTVSMAVMAARIAAHGECPGGVRMAALGPRRTADGIASVAMSMAALIASITAHGECPGGVGVAALVASVTGSAKGVGVSVSTGCHIEKIN